jgi:2-oxoisovalerate dehydrogenase E2 component (dihydrolipoyl transacylase)
MAEMRQFKLPDVGEGLTEADIVTWRVKPGDEVSVNQTIVEIETAKSLVELPCPFDGVVSRLLVPEGQTVDVGTPIIEVDVAAEAGAAPSAGAGAAEPVGGTQAAGGEAGTAGAAGGAQAAGGEAGAAQSGTAREVAAPAAQAASPAAAAVNEAYKPERGSTAPEDLVPPPPGEAAIEPGTEPGIHGGLKPKPERQAVLVGYGVKLGTTTRRPRKGGPAGRSSSSAATGTGGDRGSGTATGSGGAGAGAAGNGQAAPPAERPLAKPPVRKLAKDLGVELATLTGSGPDGIITREDVQAAAGAGQAPAAAAPRAPAGGEERIPVKGVRKHTAAAVSASAFTAPHVTEFLQIDVTQTMEAVARLRDLPEFSGLRVSPLLLVAKALLLAVARHPMINSAWDEQAQEIVVKHYVNLGIAAATGRGLLVPNIKNAHTLSLPGLARALSELAATAREGKSQPADLAGGTISITNVGVFGVDSGTPILTPGEAAILAFGQVKDAPWVHEGALAVRKVTTLALSFDHRVVDGDLGSAVLRDVGAMLTDPLRMLAWDAPIR